MIRRQELATLIEKLRLAGGEKGSAQVNNCVSYGIIPPLEPRRDATYPRWVACAAIGFLAERKEMHGSSMNAYLVPDFMRPLWILYELRVLLGQLSKARFLSNRALEILQGELDDAEPHLERYEKELGPVRDTLKTVLASGAPSPFVDGPEMIRQALMTAEAAIEEEVEDDLKDLIPHSMRKKVDKTLAG